MPIRARLTAAFRAFRDPDREIDHEMAAGALHEIHRLLDSGGIPRGTFADDHVRNLVALYNRRGAEIAMLRELPWS